MKIMTKKLIRSVMIGFCVFVLTVAIVYFVCTTVYRMSAEKESGAVVPIEQAVEAEAEPQDIRTAEEGYYIARFDGENLSVYACTGGNEEFMYTLDVRIEDIGQSELEQLKGGIVLHDKQALASFEEDFTS